MLVESDIRQSFACRIQNPGNVCSLNPQSGKLLLVKSGIWENFTCRTRNPGNFCLWNLESGKLLLVESGILGFGIRNTAQGIRNPTITVIEPRFRDTRLIRTPRYYGQLALSLGKESSYLFSKFNPLNTDTRQCGQRTLDSCPINEFS